MTTYEPVMTARTLSISIDRSPRDVYAFARVPANLPRWASGLGGTVSERDGAWVIQVPGAGEATIQFAPENPFGVLDHDVALASGAVTHIPMRVVPNGGGCEVLFTLFQRRGVNDRDFARDAAWVTRDLESLRDLLEAEK